MHCLWDKQKHQHQWLSDIRKLFTWVAVRLTKNADIDKYGFSGYGIGFDRLGRFSFPSTELGETYYFFGVDMSSSTKIHNKKIDNLILGKGPIQGLEHKLSAQKMYSINFTDHNKKFFKAAL